MTYQPNYKTVVTGVTSKGRRCILKLDYYVDDVLEVLQEGQSLGEDLVSGSIWYEYEDGKRELFAKFKGGRN